MPLKKLNLSRKRGRREERQQDEVEDDGEDEEELLLSSRQKRTRERQKKTDSERPDPESQEMTEDEMMDLALQLSKQEATSAAQRQHQEEEDMKKAIEESMISQTQPCQPPLSLSLSAHSDTTLLPPRRKLLYVDGTDVPVVEDVAARGASSVVPGLREAVGLRDNVKRKRKEGSPLPEMPDLSQTQIICSQASPSSSEPSPSQQDSDVTQNDLSQLCKSPVFPMVSNPRACKVMIPKLTQELLEASGASGMALSSQRTAISSQSDLPSLATSPTFPKSPAFPRTSILSDTPKIPGSPAFLDTQETDFSEAERSPSPVFGGASVCQRTHRMRNKTAAPSAPDDGKSSVEGTSPSRTNHRLSSLSQDSKESPQCLKKIKAMVHSEDSTEFPLNHSGKIATPSKLASEEELHEIPEQQNTVTLELTSDMTLHWSDEDDKTPSEVLPSPVFPQEGPLHQADSQCIPPSYQERFSLEAPSPSSSPKSHSSVSLCQPRPPESNNPPATSPERDPGHLQSQAATGRGPVPTAHQGAQGRAQYYWGVPFCPRGLEPDKYTKVILCQMEVYEKSLKLAQRGLLQKAEWGEPILPQPKKPSLPVSSVESPFLHVTRRPGLRTRGRRSAQAFSSPSPEEEEEKELEGNKDEEEEEENEEVEEVEAKKTVEEEKEEEDGNAVEEMKAKETVDINICEVCPESELSDDADSTQDLVVTNSRSHQLGRVPQRQPVAPVQPIQPQHPYTEEEELMEVDGLGDRDSDRNSLAPSPAPAPEPEGPAGGQVDGEAGAEEGSDDVVHVSDSPEPAPLTESEDPNAKVECPMCQRCFPMMEIELHAAYCDGSRPEEEEPDDYLSRVSLRSRRLKTRVREAIEEDVGNVPAQKMEKCFICQKVVSLRDYKTHTDNCLRQQTSNAPVRDLMSALGQTESRDSEAIPSCSTLTSRSGAVVVIDCDDEPEPGGSGEDLGFSVSTSPIKSFTSISEAKDCVIDFKNQYSGKQHSQKGGRKRTLKRFRR